MARDSQTVRDKENLKLSHGRPSHGQASGTNPPTKVPRQSQLLARSLTNCRAIKEETTAINLYWVSNQACRLSHNFLDGNTKEDLRHCLQGYHI